MVNRLVTAKKIFGSVFGWGAGGGGREGGKLTFFYTLFLRKILLIAFLVIGFQCV